ncbi:MAG: biotin carboxylase [Clostridia bacterium]|nr:biotin carboxylase [Clostridia bacterium]
MDNSINGHICIVFAQEHYNPLGLIRSLGENGINPVYFSIKRRAEVATYSKYISKLYRADSIEEGYELLIKEYGHYDYDHRPYVLFSDDKTVGYFDNHYDEIKDKFICYNAGFAGRINEFMDKQRILELAKKHGFNVLDSVVVNVGEIPEDLVYPIITKDISPNSGSWKSDVFICENEQELREAYSQITSPIVQLQRFINKKNEYAVEGFTVANGSQMMIVTALTWKYLIKGYYSPYHDVTMFKDEEMGEKLRSLFEEIGYNGIFEVEFLIDEDGTFYFLEANFRASAWNHTGSIAGMPLSYLWVKSMENGYIDANDKKEFEDFTDMSEVIDYGKRVDTGKISLAQWLLEFKQAKGTYFYDEHDPEPFKVLFEHWEDFK